jgi:flavin-dependent dehydrogenase
MSEALGARLSDGASFDAVVVGAGPAGAATARWLALQGCSVLLAEGSALDSPRVGETLAPAVQPLLRELGVWERFAALGPLPSWGVRSHWGDSNAQTHEHLLNPYGCGWSVDRRRFDRALIDAAVDAGAALGLATKLVDAEAANDRMRLRFECGGRPVHVSARVAIDATGRAAHLAQRLGAKRRRFDTLVGITTQFGAVGGEGQGYTLIEAAADGWWYSAPLDGERLVVMLMTDGDLCGRARLVAPANWRAQLRDAPATQQRVGAAPALWGPRVFNAMSQRLARAGTAPQWLAVGDAALAVDPASGSGVVRALRTARVGARAALEALQGRAADAVAAYEAERDRECADYLEQRARHYGMESRWHEHPFWQRRVTTFA